MEKINIGVIGARSLSSGLLIKLLLHHKNVNISMLISETEGEDIQKWHPFLKNIIDKKTERFDAAKIVENCDLVFLHKQKGEAIEKTSKLVEE
jgi:N-acetyl-gamma-glutamyl-phosphate reductase